MTKRWVWFPVVLLFVGWSRLASAAITMTGDPPGGANLIDVGNVVVGNTTTTNTGTLSSDITGDVVDLTITTTCTGTGAGAFTFVGNSTGLNLNAPKTIEVRYVPTARGLRECDVTMTNSGTSPVITFQVRATGVAPVVGVSPTSHTFTSVRENNAAVAGSTSSQVFTVSNTTSDTGQTLTVNSITFVGGNNGDFSVTSGTIPSSPISGPTGNTTYTVTFNPSGTGLRTTTMRIATNDPITPNLDVSLMGTGLAAVIGVTDLNFGNVTWNGSSTQNITISNSTTVNRGTLTVTSATLDQTDTWFSFGASNGCTLGSTGTCNINPDLSITTGTPTLSIRCMPPPDEVGTQTATVTFASDSDATPDNVAMLSCTSQPHPNVVLSTTSVGFGTQLVNTTSGSLPVTVSNNGNADLTFYLTEAGTDPTMFAQSTISGCGSMANPCTVTPGGNVVVSVTFTPTSRLGKSATLNFNTNDPDAGDNVRAVSLTGTGVAPVIGVSPTSYDFMGIRVSDSAATPFRDQSFTFSNASTDAGQTLTVSSVMISGTNAGDFTVQTMGSTSIAPNTNGASPWVIRFNPSAAGTRNATMTIATNDPITPMRMVSLTGTGTNGVIGVSDVNFMTVSSGMISNQNITVSNTAASNVGVLTVTSAVISSTSTWFSFAAGNGCTAGSTMCTFSPVLTAPTDKTVVVRCNPPAAASGTETATVSFTSDSDNTVDTVANLTCTAGRPNIVVSTMMLDFSDVVVNQMSTLPFTIMNNGNTNLTYWLSETGTNPAMFSESTGSTCGFSSFTPCTVMPGQTVTVNVTFTPTSPGTKTATLNINNNDPDAGDNVQTISLTGNGTAGVASANMNPIAFSNVEVGKTSGNMTLVITNVGQSNLTISNAGLYTGALPLVGMTPDYSVATGTVGAQSTVLMPSETAMWDINCHPITHGARPGTFRLVSNSFGQPNLDIGLTCNGQQGVLSVTGGTPSAAFFDFGPVPQFQSPAPYRDFTITNTGNVTINNIMMTKDAKLLGFSLVTPTPTFPVNLAPSASITVRVEFYPTSGNDGCVVTASPDCSWAFTGGWGVTPTNVTASIVTIGDGLVTGYDTSPSNPNALDFGDVRFDLTADRTFTIINTTGSGGASVGIGTMTITPGTAMSGEFSIVGCCRGSPTCVPLTGPGPGGCPTTASPFNLPPVSNPIVVTVRVDPNNRVAMMDAMLTVTSNLGGAMPNRVVPLRANSITAGIAVTPSTNVLDFGATDLDANPVSVTRRITLMNTGTASLNVGNGVAGGPELARYSFTSITGRVVPAGMPFDIDVTYTPIIEKPANQPDVATLMFPLTGIHGGPTSVTIQITGFGADRHIAVSNVPMFPDTFTNPGPLAPVLPVTITNNGDVDLNISGVMIDNDPIWTLQNPDPVVVGGRGSHDFNVVFAPVEEGKAPTGHLLIMNNDNGMPLVSVELNGIGVDRRISFGPPVNFGFVGIGLTSRLSSVAPGMPLVLSNDGGFEFRVIGLETDDSQFEITDMDGKSVAVLDDLVYPGETRQYDVKFAPTAVGELTVNGRVNL